MSAATQTIQQTSGGHSPQARRAFHLRLLLIIALIAALEVYGRYFADPTLFVPPSKIVQSFFKDIMGDARIVRALWLCIVQIAVAYVLAILFGVTTGLLVGSTHFSRRTFFPVVLVLYVIPQVSFLPLVILMFGLGPAAKIAFGFSHAIFPIIINVVSGMRTVRELHLNAAKSMGASRLDTIRHIVLPHMVPSLFTGLRLGMTLNLLGVILAELYVSNSGVGFFTRLFAEDFNPGPLFALIGSLAVIAIVFNELVRIAERRLTPGPHRKTTIKTARTGEK